MNLRPSGYEPDELPSCSIPRYLCGNNSMSINKIYYTTQNHFCQGVFKIFLFFVSAVRDLLLIVVEKLAEALEVDNLARTEELDHLVDVGIVAQAKNIVVGCASFLLCCCFAGATFLSDFRAVMRLDR